MKVVTSLDIILIGTGRDASNLNGMVERPNRTIANVTRAKLRNANLDGTFWCMASGDAVFKRCRIKPSTISSTPYELWHGHKPRFQDMRIWGCHIYIIQNSNDRQKLDPTSVTELLH